ncbi:GNAT family N-acetyltransferase [Streptomyces otsuchiensis]|uniref:GNAT family N-acetyltransferase n=1 Tax=Streptomyces otsuchiensis TaxID=2681388 RepID=UPI001D131EF1|nr:GNAT family N-acetyltransferase [Streptomyces otsuchiensis]
MYSISRLSAEAFEEQLPDLAGLLADSVDGGASVGFVKPFEHEEAERWWRDRADAVAAGTLAVWTAREDGGAVAGTVSLGLEEKPNAAHRAEIRKLLVRRESRGAGLGRALLAAAEQSAARAGVTLLMLDTATASTADHLYRNTGWSCYGVVPDYAADPDGVLEDCSFYYKRIG